MKYEMLKGFNVCNRKDCLKPLILGKFYFNVITKKNYCRECAEKINYYDEAICIKVEKDLKGFEYE
jgi:hypothetical protein